MVTKLIGLSPSFSFIKAWDWHYQLKHGQSGVELGGMIVLAII